MRRLLALTIVPGLALLAACGGSPNKPPAAASGSNPQNPVQAAFKYSTCMREHGVPNFPDPKVSKTDGGYKIAMAVPAGAGGSPALKSAETACRGLLPAGGQNPTPAQQHAREAGLVSFARCMRAHRLTGFPDPTPAGQITPAMLSAAGIDLHTPAVLKAAYACVPASHGQLSASEIAQAESGG